MSEEQKGVEDKKVGVAVKKAEVTSNEDFITKSPLFVSIKVDGFEPPKRISFDCDSVGCGKGTTWYMVDDPLPLGKQDATQGVVVDWNLKSVSYKCAKCGKSSLSVVYREMKTETRQIKFRGDIAPIPLRTPPQPTTKKVIVQVMKVGQYPEPSIVIPEALEKNLGKDSATLYRKALICRKGGYGLAAAGYIRRVVEDKTNELIEVVAKLAESEGVEANVVASIRAVGNSADYTPYEEKLKIASAVYPDSLKAGSINPLQVLFKLVSEGIHSKSEEECIKIAEETDEVFQYVFTNLKAQMEVKKAFLEKVKKTVMRVRCEEP